MKEVAWAYASLTRLPPAQRAAVAGCAAVLVGAGSTVGGPTGPPLFARSYFLNLAHAGLYGFFAFGLLLLLGPGAPRRARAWLLVLGVVLAAGLLDEWHQQQMPHRTSSLLDVGSDLLGAAATLCLARWAAVAQPDPRAGWHLAGLAAGLLLLWTFVPTTTGGWALPALRG